MPRSTGYFKNETKDYILNNFKTDCKILDVGPGIGTYSLLLSNYGYKNIDCVEIFEPYVHQYDLKSKYRNVYVGDIVDYNIDFDIYDLIILGDVLEHISYENSMKLLNKIQRSNIIICIPFESPQGEHFGNIHEIHLQEDLNLINFFDKYENFHPFAARFDYGVFVNKKQDKIFIENGEKDFPNHYENFLKRNFNNSELIYSNPSNQEYEKPLENKRSDLTIVTALWDLGRGEINNSFKRSYDSYLTKFSELLKTDVNMYIFIDPQDEEFIWKYRKKENTIINKMTLNELKEWFNFTSITNEIRKKEEWLSQAGWLPDSPQAKLESYNPVVMSKMFMLNNVTIWNPFNSEYFFWIDAGITNTVHYGYFTHDKVFDKLPQFIDSNKNFVFLTYPYEGGNEIHGFTRSDIARYCNTDYVKYVCRGGFFGGTKQQINDINGLYYMYLNSTLSEGLMGTEESIFTIIMYNHQDIITQYGIESNGLISPFFEDMKNSNFTKRVLNKENYEKNLNINKVGLYVITFNSPKQFEVLIQSMLDYDKDFIHKPKKFLLDNSTDLSTTPRYKELCEQYGFEHIKKDNIGIVGGRVFVAEHFDETGLDFYYWFEDDMAFYPKKGEVCRNGFPRYVDNLYQKSLEIISKENFDFLKLNFSEFFGDNSTQWSWYNVPREFRQSHWPKKPNLPVQGLDPNAPKTEFKHIKTHKGVPYASGEIYLCNWPIVLTKQGNYKCYLETKFAHPHEQSLMSQCFQETIKGKIKPGLLLMTPTEHNRFEHYDGNLRKEC